MTNRRDFLRTTLGTAGAGLALGALPGLGPLANASAGGGYKALVCIFLDGGLDGFDTIIPMDASAYAAHVSARTEMIDRYGEVDGDSRARGALRALGGAQADGRRFGMPRQLAPLSDMYDRGDLAVVANVGPLEEVTTRTKIRSGQGRLPARVYSHNDQASMWLTSDVEGATTGWGGRMADALAGSTSPFTSVAIDKNPSYLAGRAARPFSLGRNGLAEQRSLGEWSYGARGLAPILKEHYRASGAPLDNFFASDMQAAQRRAIDAADQLSGVLGSSSDGEAVMVKGSDLSARLAMVAKMIGLRDQLGVKRQVFYVQHDGYDTHDDQVGKLPKLQAELSVAMSRFYAETVRMGVANDVTTFTACEFGRTLNTNRTGTDHGWGGHHFVMGGAVRGGRIVGRMPDAGLDHDQATDRGRLIPTTAVDSYAGALALWMGVAPSDLPMILPRFPRFGNVSDLF